MKLHLPVCLLRSILALMVSVSGVVYGDIYVCAEGVDYESSVDSMRFYDYCKGSVAWGFSAVRRIAQEKYTETGSLDYMGELADRMPENDTTFTYDSFSNLVKDSLQCWACTATNMIEYWQSYYGPLYTGDSELFYGHTYDVKSHTDLEGVQSLRVGLLFYDNWVNQAGYIKNAISWYFNGAQYDQLKTDAPGGYWKHAVTTYSLGISTATSMDTLRDHLLNSLGYEKSDDGTFKLARRGQLSGLSIGRTDFNTGHAVTCYGVILHDDGSLKGVLLADSDNHKYGLTTYYIKQDADGYALLYYDEACTSSWNKYHIYNISYVRTQDSMVEKYEAYYSDETPLVWSGKANRWYANATLDYLPDTASGWCVYVEDQVYNSFFHQDRKVKFTDDVANAEILIEGDLSVSDFHLENTAQTYQFSAATEGKINADNLTITGKGGASFNNLIFETNNVSYADYDITLCGGASLVTQTASLQSGATLRMSAARLETNQLTLRSGSSLEIYGKGNELELGTLTIQLGSDLFINMEMSDSILGSLGATSVSGDVWNVCFPDDMLFESSSYMLFTLSGDASVWNGVFTSSEGEFTILNNILYFNPSTHYQRLTWTSGDGFWSSSRWNGHNVESAGYATVMNGAADYTVTIEGEVSSLKHMVNNSQGTITLAGADSSAQIGGSTQVFKKGQGTLIINTANTYTGNTNLEEGCLIAGHAQAFGAGELVISGGVLEINGLAIKNNLTIQGDSVVQNGHSFGGDFCLDSGNMTGSALQLNREAEVRIGCISNVLTGSGTLVKTGGNSVTLSGNNTYTGGTRITGGTLVAGHSSALGSGGVSLENGCLVIGVNGFGNQISASGISFVNVADGYELHVAQALKNTGTLTLSGMINADALPVTTVSSGYIDAQGNYTTSGFVVKSAHSVFALVDGGTALAENLNLTYNNIPYRLSKSGIAVPDASDCVDHTKYYSLQGHAVRTSDAMTASKGLLTIIYATGGTVYIDADMRVIGKQKATAYLECGLLTGGFVDSTIYATGGYLKAGMNGGTTLIASGNLTLDASSNNQYTGGTTFNGGFFNILHPTVLGRGSISTNGETTLNSPIENFDGLTNKYTNIPKVINNSGTLTLIGIFNASDLPLITSGADSYVNADGETANSGFLASGGRSVKVVEGGTLIADATVKHGDFVLTLGNDGYARDGENTVHYNVYYLNAGDSVKVSSAKSYSSDTLERIEMTGGTLYADADTTIAGSGGSIVLSSGNLAGTITDTNVTATGGTLSAEIMGSSTLTASGNVTLNGGSRFTGGTVLSGGVFKVARSGAMGLGSITTTGNTTIQLNCRQYWLDHVISNTGVLTLNGGTYVLTNLPIETITGGVYIDAEGKSGESGFESTGGQRVQVVRGGTVSGNSAFKHGDYVLTLGSDGYAVSGCTVDYSTYYLTGTDSVRVSTAESYSSGALETVRMSSGTLYADASTAVAATGGTIELTGGTLTGTAQDTSVTATGGTLKARLSGSSQLTLTGGVTVAASNTHTGGIIIRDGSIKLTDANALSSGAVTTSGTTTITPDGICVLKQVIRNSGTLTLSGRFNANNLTLESLGSEYVDVNGNSSTSGFAQSSGYKVQVVDGGTVTAGAIITHGEYTLTLGSDGYAVCESGDGEVNYVNYYLNGTDSVSLRAAKTASGNALRMVNMTGGSLYADFGAMNVTSTGGNIMLSTGVLSGTVKDAAVSATDGTLSAVLSGTSSLTASGKLTIRGANSHTGGSIFSSGTFALDNARALGSGAVITTGSTTLNADTTVNLSGCIINSGSLTLTGTYDVSSLSLNAISSSYVGIDGATGDSGFRRAAGYSVQVVNGGTVSGDASIKHGSLSLTLGSDGYATSGGGITYSTYYLNAGDSVSVIAAERASSNALTSVSMTGGTLYADASTMVTSTGGHIMLTGGTLSGTVKNATVNATSGTLSAVLSGTSSLSARGTITISGANTHTGGSVFNGGTITLSNAKALGSGTVMTTGTTTLKAGTAVTLSDCILNSGTLTMSDTWNISALDLLTTAATRVDTNGRTGESGFARAALYEAQVVLGGTSKASNLTLTHGSLPTGKKLVLGSNGLASAGGEVNYSTYYLTGDDRVSVSDAEDASNGVLSNIVMNGGKLTVDESTRVTATGGSISITDDSTLSGSIANTDITTEEGNYRGTISATITGSSSLTIDGGNVTLTGNNSYTGGTTINGGSLTANNAAALGSGSVTVNNGTLDLNNQGVGNDIILNNGSLTGNGNYTGDLTIGGDNVTVEGGYTLGAGSVLEIAPGGTEFGSDLTLSGGTLLFKGAPLAVDGEVSFTAGTTTLVDLRQWEGNLTDGLTLAQLGTDVTGWQDGCLELIGMSDMELLFNDATGALTLQIAGQQPASEVITWLGAKKTVWQQGKAGWMNATTGYDAIFLAGADVIFTQAGTVTIVGAVEPGSLIVAGDKNVTFKADRTNPGRIVGETSLVKRGNGKLTLNDGNLYSGGTFIESGTVTAGGASSFGRGDITISGGTLDLRSKAVANDITLTGAATIKGGKKYLGSVTLDGDLLKSSVLNLVDGETATLMSGTMNGTLSGTGTVAVTGKASIGTTGKLTTSGLDVTGTLDISAKGLSMNTKTSEISVTNGGHIRSAGALKAYSMELNNASVELRSTKASSVSLTGNLTMRNGADMYVTGKMTVGGLRMYSSSLTITDPTGLNKPQGLTSKGNVTLGSGSHLTLNGKLTANNLTLNSGSLTLTSNKLQTITVKNSLTLGRNFDLNFDFDLVEGKAVKLFTFKTISGNSSDLYSQLGLSDDYCSLTLNAKDITLTVTDLEGLRDYMESNTQNADAQTLASAADDEAEPLVAELAYTVDPMLAGLADTLVQSTWGVAGASRAFAETISGRGAHATLLEGGKGAAWVSTMGGSSRISSDGGHTGADFTLSGAAIGIEGNVTEKSTIGLAIGNSWGKVSPFSAYRVDQDSTHYGLYGNHALRNNLTLSWMAAHTRAESDGNLAGMDCDWTQDALQLDARLTWARALNEKTTISAFGGLQYLATDSADFNGLSTGSVQNLRTEIGAGITHKVAPATQVYGELSFIGDVARNNPTATVGDYRTRGANPGRVGMNLHIGAAHQLNDSWSVNAGYSFELQKNATSHGLNVGASYKF